MAAGAAVQVGPAVPAVVGQTEYMLIDQQELPNGPFTYYVVADFGAVTSDESNNVTITAVNDAPVATGESYSTNYRRAARRRDAGRARQRHRS